MHPIARSMLHLIDHACRSLATSAPCMRLLDLVSREEPAPGDGDGRGSSPSPDLEYGGPVSAGDPVPTVAPRGIQAWEVRWKPRPAGSADDLGYQGVAGFYLPRPNGQIPLPGVLVLPILHDPFSLASGALARYLALQGFAALELRSGPPFLDRVRVTSEGPGLTCEDVETEMIRTSRRALDWLCRHPGVDEKSLGIIGISHGAILGPCVMGADSRLSAGVFCMGGADEAMIVARSREPSVRRFRERIMRAHSLTDPDDLTRLPQGRDSRTEPLRYAPAIDPRSVLLFKTRLDRFVVPEAQDKLWEALGRPRRITLPLGHLGFGLAFYYVARRGAEFLRGRFALQRRQEPGERLAG